jgi:sulfite exporter TauE/SafE
MLSEMGILIITTISVACLHTATGPDHYLPFIVLAKTRNWSKSKMIGWTILCGCGHVCSAVLLGLGAAAIGWSVTKIGWLENIRGGIAGWVMLAFGLCYFIWGLNNAYKNKAHKHFDVEDSGDMYVYEHKHGQIQATKEKHKVTPWVMFIIFLLGPCEPMIPLLYYPAAKSSWWAMTILIIVYTFFTLLTMVVMVLLGLAGIGFLKTEKLERYVHAIGGFTILLCGVGMLFLGW